MKKNYLLILILTLLFCWYGTNNALAATGISDAEQLILDKMRAGAKINGEMKYIPIAYVNQTENEFMSNNEDLTEEQAALVIAKIEEAVKLISQMGTVDIMNIQNSEVALELLTIVGEVANEVNYEVSFDIANRSVNVKNPDGGTVFLAKNIVNQTGFNIPSIVLVSGLILSIVMVSIVSSVILIITGRRDQRLQQRIYHGRSAIGTYYEE